MKKQFIKDLKPGDRVDSLFAVKFKKPVKNYVKGYMYEARVADKTGEITAKYWGDNDENSVQKLYDDFQKPDVIRVTGTANEYMGRLEIGISKTDRDILEKTDEYDVTDFVASSERDIDEMMNELTGTAESIKNAHLKTLLEKMLKDEKFIDRFKKSPASMMYHQNCVGGLLEHTLNVVKICETLCEIYPVLDRDLLIAGALLHDVGKVFELEVSTVIDVSEDGMLRGHIIIGEEFVNERIKKIIDFPETLKLKLLHMILSHHGEKRFGAPKEPQLPEAVALHYADYCDAKVDLFLKAKSEAKTEDKWIWDKKLGHVYLK